MGRKRYKSLTGIQYTFPVNVNGKQVWVSFKGNEDDYVTSDAKVQAAIETTDKFKQKMIGLVEGKESVNKSAAWIEPATEVVIPANPVIEPKEDPENPIEDTNPEDESKEPQPTNTSYPDVVDINGAVTVLKGEPYNVHHLSLRTPEAVAKQAAANNVVFPNWKTE